MADKTYIGQVNIIDLIAYKDAEYYTPKTVKEIQDLIEDYGGEFPDYVGSSSTVASVTYSARTADVDLLHTKLISEYPFLTVYPSGTSEASDDMEADFNRLVIELV